MSSGRLRLSAVRQLAGQQLVQHDAERIDVAYRRHGLAAHLLRARVIRRHHAQPIIVAGDLARIARLQELGDAEVEQLRHAVGADQDVRRLQVAMDDGAAVRVGDRGADLAEQLQPLGESRACASQYSSIGRPSTYSITKYGRPSSVVPPSSRRAMFG